MSKLKKLKKELRELRAKQAQDRVGLEKQAAYTTAQLQQALDLLGFGVERDQIDTTCSWDDQVRTVPGPARLALHPALQDLLHSSPGLTAGLTLRDVVVRETQERVGGPDFTRWWTSQVEEHGPTIQAKAQEYGSNSLRQVGALFLRDRGLEGFTETEELVAGCAVYAHGKLERVLDALLAGTLPSDDTLHDLQVYAAMAQYIKTTGVWP